MSSQQHVGASGKGMCSGFSQAHLHLQAVVACQKMDGSRPALLRVVPEQNVSGYTAHHSAQVQHNRRQALY